MIEAEARELVEEIVGPTPMRALERFVAMLVEASGTQNLIARSTIPEIWTRHVLDSAQLLKWGEPHGTWIDIGTGGGFPGVVVAIARDAPVLLVEPRKQRAAFLSEICEKLGLAHVSVIANKIESLDGVQAATISARAVASVHALFAMSHQCADCDTRWLLPRGQTWQCDLEAAVIRWDGAFHVEQSLSNAAARIIVATGVSRR